jgi:hypothetical protein
VIREFPEHGYSLIMQGNVPIQGVWTKIAYANVVMYVEDDCEFRLRISKCRFGSITDSSLYKFLKEDFPSITIERRLYPDAPGFDSEVNDYVIFNDDTDAVHFKLKYC